VISAILKLKTSNSFTIVLLVNRISVKNAMMMENEDKFSFGVIFIMFKLGFYENNQLS